MRESRESKWMGAPASPPVVVLGAGFAGLRAVRRLGRAGVDTLWVDARNYHCFLPLLYQVATAGLEPQDIAYPARSILRHLRAVDFRLARVAAGDPAALRLVVLEAGEHVLPPYPPALRERARRDLETFGVEVHTGRRVERVAGDHVELSGGERLATATVIWAAGIRAAPVAAWLGLPTGRSGRLEVAPTLQVPGVPAVFAAGDVALVEGAERLPQVAQVAIQQGELAAENVLGARRGQPLLPFRYADKGSMATIGRSRAVAVVKGVHLQGRLAWWAWLVVHLVMLIGFRNRLVVLVNWAWNYFTYDRGLRAIVGEADEAGGPGTRAPRPA